MKNKQQVRFNDEKYIEDYKNLGIYPKIHNDIYFSIIMNIKNKELTVFDLGSCTGLLTIRLANYFNKVIGIEYSKEDMLKSIAKPNVDYVNTKINDLTINKLIVEYKPDLIVCRRVLPEISDNNEDNIVNFVDTISKHKIKFIAIEGRQVSIKSTHLLSSIDKEISYFTDYKQIDRYKNVSILKHNESI